MKKSLVIFILAIATSLQAQTAEFSTFLTKNVDKHGNVNYANMSKDNKALNSYIDYLAKTSPTKNWSKSKTKAFWINAYNAYTLKLILESYPLKSILKVKKKGKDAWNIPFANVGGKNYTLNHIEHKILRKNYNDPRIHVGINCASKSCPKLANFAFTEKNIDTELEKLMKEYINDTSRNVISEKKLQLSKILEWFKDDFTKNGSLIDYLNKYSNTKISNKAKVQFLKYNWNLNGK